MFIAGRIEFLGKHTDYCGGRSIVCAIDKGFQISFEPNLNNLIVVKSTDTQEEAVFDLNGYLKNKSNKWSVYPQTVIQRLAQNFQSRKLQGLTINFSSNLPQAAGVSSSSALIVAVFSAISKFNDLPDFDEYKNNIRDRFDLGNYLGCLENGCDFGALHGNIGVGTFGGSQDQTAIICGKRKYLSRFSFCPVRHEGDFEMPENLTFVVAASGVIAEKTGAAKEKYNRLSLMVKEICKLFDENLSLSENVEKYGFEKIRSKLSNQELIKRLTQFHLESNELIPMVSAHLKNGEIDKIGVLIDKSHRNADELLGNQVSETNFLQANARELGAFAASAFGAGFGGSVYALVKNDSAEDFAENWKENYLKNFPQHSQKAEFFLTKAGESKFD